MALVEVPERGFVMGLHQHHHEAEAWGLRGRSSGWRYLEVPARGIAIGAPRLDQRLNQRHLEEVLSSTLPRRHPPHPSPPGLPGPRKSKRKKKRPLHHAPARHSCQVQLYWGA